jgi:hypothetical protein
VAASPAIDVTMSTLTRLHAVSLSQEHLLTFDETVAGMTRVSRTQYAVSCRCRDDLDVPALRRALNAVVERHEALRMTFHKQGGDGAPDRGMHLALMARTGLFMPGLYGYRVEPSRDVPFVERDCREHGQPVSEDAIWEQVAREAADPLPLEAGPCLRAVLVRGGPWPVLVLVLSHLTVDGWSVGILVEELNVLYCAYRRGIDADLPSPDLQFPDFIRWQRYHLLNGGFQEHEDHWCRTAAALSLDSLQPSRIPFFSPPKVTPERKVGTAQPVLSHEEEHAVREFVRALRLTPYVVFRAAFSILWSHYTGTTDTTLWANFINRDVPGSTSMIGWCSTTHPVPLAIDRHARVHDVCQQLSDVMRTARSYEALPLPAIFRRLGRNPFLGSTRINFDLWPEIRVSEPRPIEALFAPQGLPTTELDVRLRNVRGETALIALYNANNYAEADIERLLSDTRRILMRFCADRHATITDCLSGL